MMASIGASGPPAPPGQIYVAVRSVAPLMNAWPFDDASGPGTQYDAPIDAPTAVTNTATLNVQFSPSGTAIVAPANAAPFVNAYRWSNETGWGARYANPSVAISSAVRGVRFNAAGNRIILCISAAPWVEAYEWSDATGFGTKFAAPSPAIAGNPGPVPNFTSSENGLVFGAGSVANAIAWNNTTGFGAAYPPPVSPVTTSVAYLSPDGTKLFGLSASSPFIHAWNWNNTTGIGTKFADPAVPPNGAPFTTPQIFFNASGTRVMCSDTTGISLSAYVWSNTTGFGGRFTADVSGGSVRAIAFNQAKNLFIINVQNNPTARGVNWDDNTGFSPATVSIPGLNNTFACVFSPDL